MPPHCLPSSGSTIELPCRLPIYPRKTSIRSHGGTRRRSGLPSVCDSPRSPRATRAGSTVALRCDWCGSMLTMDVAVVLYERQPGPTCIAPHHYISRRIHVVTQYVRRGLRPEHADSLSSIIPYRDLVVRVQMASNAHVWATRRVFATHVKHRSTVKWSNRAWVKRLRIGCLVWKWPHHRRLPGISYGVVHDANAIPRPNQRLDLWASGVALILPEEARRRSGSSWRTTPSCSRPSCTCGASRNRSQVGTYRAVREWVLRSTAT